MINLLFKLTLTLCKYKETARISLLLLLLLYIPVVLVVVSPRIVVIGNANIFLLVHVIIIPTEWIAVLCHDGILLVIFADNDVRRGTANDH